ncbi:MAG: SPOR domain-containing protein [Bacteroidia bacterium]|nr:SPOR domain-containing protein [Bacteroidia bacterium]
MKLWAALGVLVWVGPLGWAQTAAPYTRYEAVSVDHYRRKVTYDDPYRALPPPAKVPALDTTRRKLQVAYLQSDAIARLAEKLVAQNRSVTTAQGYRIQVFVGDRGGANNAKYQAQTLFPDQVCYVDFERPYFKVRLGDFLTQTEAEEVLRAARTSWQGAFLVPATVNLNR